MTFIDIDSFCYRNYKNTWMKFVFFSFIHSKDRKMATASIRRHCSLCPEENTYICTGCSNYFCFDHLKEHRDIITQGFNQTEDDYNSLIENLNEQMNNPNQRLFMKEINQWKQISIQRIEQVAKECERDLIDYTNKRFFNLKNDLNEKLKENVIKDKSNENQLNQLKERLKLLNKQFEEILNVSFTTKTTFFIDRIYFKQSKVSLIHDYSNGRCF